MTKKILIVGPAWVGDMVMAQALFITLQAQAQTQGVALSIDVLAPAWSRPLLERMPQVRRAIDMPFKHGELKLAARFRLGHSLRKERYAQVIVLPNSFKSAILIPFVRSPVRTGWRGEARSLLLNDMRQLDRQALPLMVQRFVALGLPAGAPLPDPMPRPRLVTVPESVAAALVSLQVQTDRPVLVICPGAEFGDAKQWPAEHFARVCQDRIEAGWQVWVLGSAKDTAIALRIKGLLQDSAQKHCHDLTGRTALAEAIDLMSLAGAVLSNDSGLMHVAAALARPIVALYGSTSADFTPPLADDVQLLSVDIDCRPCFKRVCPLQHKRCLVDLLPERALAALDSVVSRAAVTPVAVSASISSQGTEARSSAGERNTSCES